MIKVTVLYMTTILWGLLVSASVAFAAENVSPPRVDAARGTVSNEAALKILSARCTSCHTSESPPGNEFLTSEKLSEKSTRDLLNTVIRKSKMPKAHRDFKNTKDGKEILKWIDGK